MGSANGTEPLTPEQLAAVADYVYVHMHEAHRGVMEVGNRIIAFGNDGYRQCQHARAYVADWKRMVDDADGWACWLVCPLVTRSISDGYTWVAEVTRYDGGLWDSDEERDLAYKTVRAQLWTAYDRHLKRRGAKPNNFQQQISAAIVPHHQAAVAHLLGIPHSRNRSGRDRMLPLGYLLAQNGGEPIRLLVDGIPYSAQLCTGDINCTDEENGLPVGYELAVLLENVGTLTPMPGPPMPFAQSGTLATCRATGNLHDTTGERLFVTVDWDEVAEIRKRADA